MGISKLIPQSLYGKLTLGLVVIQALTVIILESIVAGIFLPINDQIQNTAAKGIPVYLMIFLFSQVFQVVLCFDAVLQQNTIQIIAFVIFDALVFAYSLFQLVQLRQALQDPNFQSIYQFDNFSGILIAISIVLGVCVALFIFFAYKLYLEFGWKIYKRIGADPRMKMLVLNQNDPEFALTIVALPITLIVILFAVYGVRQESKPVMISFMIGCLLAMAYFIFKLARMYDVTQAFKYQFIRNFLTFFAALSLVFVSLTLINAVMCYLNFDKGLKQHVQIKKRSNNQNQTEMTQTGTKDTA